MSIGRELLRTLEAIHRAIPQAASSQDLDALRLMRARVLMQIEAMVEANLDADSREYQAATRRLQAASASMHLALSEMAQVGKAVDLLRAALDGVASLVP